MMDSHYNNTAFFVKRLQYFNHHVMYMIPKRSQQKGYFVLHLESIFSEDYVLPADPGKNVVFVDITRLSNIKAFLLENNITQFVFPDPKNIMDFLLLHICRDIKCKTVYSQHGFRINFNVFRGSKLFPKKRLLMFDRMTIKKYFVLYKTVLRNLAYLTHRGQFILRLVGKTLRLLVNPAKELSETLYLCDKAYVYGRYDKDILVNNYGYRDENVVISGYPIVLKTSRSLQHNGRGFVLYISGGLRETGVLDISFEEEIEFYRRLSFEVNSGKDTLVVKLHPSENLERYSDLFSNYDKVRFCYNEDLEMLTSKSRIVVGDYSTALFYAVLLYKPIVIVPFEQMPELPFDYSHYGVGIRTSLSHLSTVISRESTLQVDISRYDEFIDYFIAHNQENGQTVLVSNDDVTKSSSVIAKASQDSHIGSRKQGASSDRC